MTLPKHLQEEFEKEFPNNVHELKGKNGIPSGSVNVNKELLAFLSHVYEEAYQKGLDDMTDAVNRLHTR